MTNPKTTQAKNIEFQAIEFESAGEAIQYAQAAGKGEAILVNGKNLVVDQAVSERLTASGVEFAYLCEHKKRIVTIPVN